MSKIYDVKKIKNGIYTYLVVANSYESPLDVLDEISKEIEVPECTILFDMLLRTGMSYNRYLSIRYKDNQFDKKSISIVTQISNDIKLSTVETLNKHISCVEESLLPEPIKFLIKKKLPV